MPNGAVKRAARKRACSKNRVGSPRMVLSRWWHGRIWGRGDRDGKSHAERRRRPKGTHPGQALVEGGRDPTSMTRTRATVSAPAAPQKKEMGVFDAAKAATGTTGRSQKRRVAASTRKKGIAAEGV